MLLTRGTVDKPTALTCETSATCTETKMNVLSEDVHEVTLLSRVSAHGSSLSCLDCCVQQESQTVLCRPLLSMQCNLQSFLLTLATAGMRIVVTAAMGHLPCLGSNVRGYMQDGSTAAPAVHPIGGGARQLSL